MVKACFLPKIWNKKVSLLLLLLFKIVVEVLASAIRPQKKVWKREMRTPIYSCHNYLRRKFLDIWKKLPKLCSIFKKKTVVLVKDRHINQ